jgi:hypothetical protein
LLAGTAVYAIPGFTSSIDNAGYLLSIDGIRLGDTSTVTNEGTVVALGSGPPAYGVYAKHGGTVTNGTTLDHTAFIAGYNGIRFVKGVGASYYGYVTNFGGIEGDSSLSAGVYDGQGGTVSNGASNDTTALIQAGRWGVYIFAGSVTNYRTVSSTYAGNAGAGVYISNGTAEVANLGSNALIKGYYGVALGYGTITNGGTIASNQGTSGTAIKFAAGADRVIIEPGATFIGTVVVENPLNSGATELAGTTAATFTGPGTRFTNFSTVDVDAGANWTLAGNNTILSGCTFGIAGSLAIGGDVSNDAGFTLTGGRLELESPSYVTPGSSFTFGAGGSDLLFDAFGSGTIVNTIIGFAGNETIDLPGLAFQSGASATVSGTTLAVVSNGATVNLTVAGLTDGMSSFTQQDSGTGTEIIACFAAGTRIATPTGEVPVEHLRIGDLVHTESGGVAPVQWIGRRTYAATRVAKDPQLRPVCVREHALAEGVPARDLLLSPAHALLVDGALVPAVALVNGHSITRAPRDAVAYFHLELDHHDILLADGAPAESFTPLAGRAMFDNAAEFRGMDIAAPSCRPRLEDGPVLEAIRQRLAERVGLQVSATSPGPLRGHVEPVVPTFEGQQIEGWLFDEHAPDQPVELEVTAEGAAPVRLLANRYRSDLDRAGLAGGRCGFLLRLPTRGSVTVRRATDGAKLPTAA